MRRLTLIILSISFILSLLSGCGKKTELFPKVTKDAPQYEFFKTLSEKVALVDPDNEILLLETTEFKLTTQTILFPIYQDIFNYTRGEVEKFTTEPVEKIKNFIKRGAERIAENRLIIIEAKKEGFEAKEDSVEIILNQMYEQIGGEEQFLKNLEKRHLTLEQVKDEIRDNSILDQYLNKSVFRDIQISESEIMAIYSQDKKAAIRHILMITKDKSAADKSAIYEKMQGILKKLKAGGDFAKLAKQYSEDPGSNKQGGLIKNIDRGDMFPEIDEVIFSLPVDEISGLIESKIGYHIIKVTDREQDPRGYEEAKTRIIEELSRPAKTKALQDKVDALKRKYQLKIVAIPS